MMRAVIFIFILVTMLRAQELVVVTSAELDFPKLDMVEVERIFLSKTNHLGSQRVKIAELKADGIKQRFYAHVSGKSLTQLRAYWTKLIFTGKAQPPKQVANVENLKEMLQSGKIIITYLPVEQVDDSMRVLYTLKD